MIQRRELLARIEAVNRAVIYGAKAPETLAMAVRNYLLALREDERAQSAGEDVTPTAHAALRVLKSISDESS